MFCFFTDPLNSNFMTVTHSELYEVINILQKFPMAGWNENLQQVIQNQEVCLALNFSRIVNLGAGKEEKV